MRRALLAACALGAIALTHCNALIATPDGHLRPDAAADDAGADAAILDDSNPNDSSADAASTSDDATSADAADAAAPCDHGALQEDPRNCGACGHLCRGRDGTGLGACIDAECTSYVVTDHQPFASSVAPDELSDGYVYFTNTVFGPDGSVARVKKSGAGKVEILYHADTTTTNPGGNLIDRPSDIVLFGDRVYWSSTNANDGPYGRVHWANRDGTGHGSIGAWNGPAAPLVDRDGTLFWVNRWDMSAIVRASTADLGAAPRTVLTFPDGGTREDTLGLRADSLSIGNLFFCTPEGIRRVSKLGGSAVPLTSVPCTALAFDGTYLYFGHDSVVYRRDAVDLAKKAEIIADLGLGVDDSDHYTTAAAVDGRYVYVERFDRQDSRIFRMRSDGSELLQLASGIRMGAGLAVDDEAIYWASQVTGEIRKIWK